MQRNVTLHTITSTCFFFVRVRVGFGVSRVSVLKEIGFFLSRNNGTPHKTLCANAENLCECVVDHEYMLSFSPLLFFTSRTFTFAPKR